ncbi:Protein CBG19591 [Caenorhabditis briggsae]|uniref:Protein CBG19591 n=1 Tax=Caenorhabditis briggsae TaxID=6238 RepID=A8XVY9_CAEBR|nr:Protein CBG19591 [Caenorhabditis briggsae]CAP36808.1 Protein CBG19591 [Caenorhabditis briggsae]
MAFYFALLNVSKKDNTQEKSSSSSHHHSRKHRRHSIASVESPLLDYRLLPRPQLLSDDVVITNELAQQIESCSSSVHPNNRLADRRSRGSARASKWVQDNHHHNQHAPLQREPNHQATSSRAPLTRNDTESDPPPLSRSKRMAFGGEESKETKKRGGVVRAVEERKRGERHSEEEEGGGKQKTLRRRAGKKEDVEEDSGKERRNQKKDEGKEGGGGPKKEDGRKKEPIKTMRRGTKSHLPVPIPASAAKSQNTAAHKKDTKPEHLQIKYSAPLSLITSNSSSALSSSARYASPPASAATVNGRKPRGRADNPLRSSVFQVMAGSSATDESGRSCSQMSNESTTPRRDDSPASSCCDPKEQEVAMKLSAISMSSRTSEPRLKKVTFESSPYVISNSFLGDGAGKVLVVRRGSGTAVRRICNGWNQPKVLIEGVRDEVSGDDWWTHCAEGEEQEAINDNHMNKTLEKEKRSILRRGLIRRRSTSDKSRLLAYRNSGFLSSSQERKSESTPASRMTVSVDRPKYK